MKFLILIFFIFSLTASAESAPQELSLEECLSIALKNGSLIELARENIIVKESEFAMSKSSMLPRFSFTTGYLHQSNPSFAQEIINREVTKARSSDDSSGSSTTDTRSNIKRENDAWIASFGVTQFIHTGGLYGRLKELREKEINLSKLEHEESISKTKFLVMAAYLKALIHQESVTLLDLINKLANDNFLDLEKRFKLKDISNEEFLESEITLLESEKELKKVQEEYYISISELSSLINRPIPFNTKLKSTNKNISTSNTLEFYLKKGPEDNINIQKSLSRVHVGEVGLQLANAEGIFTPKLLLYGSFEHQQDSGTESDSVIDYTLGIGMMVPLYDGSYTKASREKAASLLRQARIGYEIEKQAVELEIKKKFNLLLELNKEKDILEKKITLAQTQMKKAQTAYKMNVIDINDRTKAQIAVHKAQLEFLKNSLTRNITYLELSILSGDGINY